MGVWSYSPSALKMNKSIRKPVLPQVISEYPIYFTHNPIVPRLLVSPCKEPNMIIQIMKSTINKTILKRLNLS